MYINIDMSKDIIEYEFDRTCINDLMMRFSDATYELKNQWFKMPANKTSLIFQYLTNALELYLLLNLKPFHSLLRVRTTPSDELEATATECRIPRYL